MARKIIIALIATPLILISGIFIIFTLAYAFSDEKICQDGESYIWNTKDGTTTCQNSNSPFPKNWEVVRVGEDNHIPVYLHDRDFKKWQKTVREPIITKNYDK